EVERQAAELVAQAQDHIAEDEGPLPGADEKQRRASALVDVVDPLGLDFHEPTLEGKGRMRKPGGAFRKSRRVISHETDPLQMVEFVFDLSMWPEGCGRLPRNHVDPGNGNPVLGGYQPRPCRK